jgi:crotonobetainyl-CoA:carnitine CoA-transferase CaiB-like acyl-CoA transferase
MSALAGVRVIDFGQYLAGPFGPMILADLGADVIKVEPVTGDGMRPVTKPFVGCQRGKRAVALNLKDPRGVELALALVATADVVHHNMTVGVADRLGIGYEACRAVKPDIVYCNTYAYGAQGPLAHFGGLDPLFQASAGIEWDQGPVEAGHPPLYLRFGMADTANAFASVVGCLLALLHQRRTGQGQELWTSLLDAAQWLEADALLVDGEPRSRPRLDAGQCGLGPGYRLYATQEGWLQVAAVTPAQWRALCEVVGAPELADVDPAAERERCETALADRFATRTALGWSRLLDDAGVPNEVALDTKEGELVLFDADAERLGLVADAPHAVLGRLRQFGPLVQFSGAPARAERPPPRFGEHTREILAELGLSAAEIDDLHAAGVVASPPDPYPWPV